MKNKRSVVWGGMIAAVGLLCCALPAPAASLSAMQAAAEWRAAVATAVARGAETPEAAVERLQKAGGASGLTLAADADLALAALDIGHRLLAFGRPDAAEAFFRVAEQNLEKAASRTSAGQRREKAGYLQNLAYVRGNYLGKIAQARADIDEAIALQPDDPALQDARRALARGREKQLRDARNP